MRATSRLFLFSASSIPWFCAKYTTAKCQKYFHVKTTGLSEGAFATNWWTDKQTPSSTTELQVRWQKTEQRTKTCDNWTDKQAKIHTRFQASNTVFLWYECEDRTTQKHTSVGVSASDGLSGSNLLPAQTPWNNLRNSGSQQTMECAESASESEICQAEKRKWNWWTKENKSRKWWCRSQNCSIWKQSDVIQNGEKIWKKFYLDQSWKLLPELRKKPNKLSFGKTKVQ